MIAYFSMEIGVAPEVPTYAGGLGVLAGDTVRAAADLGLPFAAVTLLHRIGYFRRRLDADGRQREEPVDWSVERALQPLPPRGQCVHQRPARLRNTGRTTVTDDDVEAVRRMCVCTSRTPVVAALDRFPPALVEQVLGPNQAAVLTAGSGLSRIRDQISGLRKLARVGGADGRSRSPRHRASEVIND